MASATATYIALERAAPVPDGLPLSNLTSAAVVLGTAPADASGLWSGTSDGLTRCNL